MPAKKSKTVKKPAPKKPAKAAKKPVSKPKAKPAKAAKTKPSPNSKVAKPASKGKKAPVIVKKTSVKPASKKTPSKPDKKSAKSDTSAPESKKKSEHTAPAKAVVAEPPPAKVKKSAQPPLRGVVPITKPLNFAPMKPTPRRVVEEVGATIEIAKGPVKMTPFLKKQKQRLIDLRDSLLNSIEGVSNEGLRKRAEGSEASAFGMHQADAGSDAYDRDFALSLLSQEQDALYEINEALKRIDNGTYGICEMSGKRVPEVRLEALPFTRYTVECQSRIEQNQMGGRWRRPVRSLFGLDDATDNDDDSGDEEETTTSSRGENSGNNANEALDFAKE